MGSPKGAEGQAGLGLPLPEFLVFNEAPVLLSTPVKEVRSKSSCQVGGLRFAVPELAGVLVTDPGWLLKFVFHIIET